MTYVQEALGHENMYCSGLIGMVQDEAGGCILYLPVYLALINFVYINWGAEGPRKWRSSERRHHESIVNPKSRETRISKLFDVLPESLVFHHRFC